MNEWLQTEEHRWFEPSTNIMFQHIHYQRHLELTIAIGHNGYAPLASFNSCDMMGLTQLRLFTATGRTGVSDWLARQRSTLRCNTSVVNLESPPLNHLFPSSMLIGIPRCGRTLISSPRRWTTALPWPTCRLLLDPLLCRGLQRTRLGWLSDMDKRRKLAGLGSSLRRINLLRLERGGRRARKRS